MEFLTAEEIAAKLRVSPWVVARLCRNGELEAVKVGKTWRISRAAFDAYLEAQSNQKVAS